MIWGLQPWLSPYAEALLQYFPQLQITSTYRSYSQQLQLWRKRAMNRYPVAPPGQSYHQYGRAFDVAGPDDQLAAAGAIWRSWGGFWSERDNIHFQA
jgi:hypothetical protein